MQKHRIYTKTALLCLALVAFCGTLYLVTPYITLGVDPLSTYLGFTADQSVGFYSTISEGSAPVTQGTRLSAPKEPPGQVPRIVSTPLGSTICDHWAGESVYRPVEKGESWTWLMVFLYSIPQKLDEVDTAARFITQEIYRHRLTFPRSTGGGVSAVSLRFADTKVPSIEKSFIATNSAGQHHIVQLPRYECVTGLCRGTTSSEEPQVRNQINVASDAEVVFVNFLYADTYDVDRSLQHATRAAVLVTTFWTEPSAHAADSDYPLSLYDLFHKMFFRYNWTPKIGSFFKCLQRRYGCSAWIVWTRWSFDKDRLYIPPAGDGSDYREMSRLRHFYANPCEEFCKTRQMFGGNDSGYTYVDGGYTVCLDTLPSPTPETCIVYSFGINNEWSFDDALRSLGCSVYSFDPSMNLEAHQRGAHHWFYPWGLGVQGSQGNWTLMHFQEIRRQLGHRDTIISVLKLDVEKGEWDLLHSNSLEKDLSTVVQFVGEIHPTPEMTINPLYHERALHNVEKLGFAMFSARRNPGYRDVRVGAVPPINDYLYEPSYINLRYLRAAQSVV